MTYNVRSKIKKTESFNPNSYSIYLEIQQRQVLNK